LFTFVGASRGHLCDSKAFLLLLARSTYMNGRVVLALIFFIQDVPTQTGLIVMDISCRIGVSLINRFWGNPPRFSGGGGQKTESLQCMYDCHF